MSLTTTVQDWMRGVGDRENSATIVRAHVAAETSTDVDNICATISHDVYFGVPVRTRDGQELRDGSVLTTYDQVRGYYEGRSGSYVVLDSAQLKSIATDWYLFNETAATLRGTGTVGEIDAAGKEWIVNSAVLFPSALDGIRGEICITRYPMDDVVADTVRVAAPPIGRQTWMPLREMELGALLDRFILEVRDGEWSKVRSDLSDAHTLAVRLDDVKGDQLVLTATDGDSAGEAFQKLFEGAEDLTLLNRLASEWYVFAEYLVRLEGGGVRRLAVTHPVENGKLTGTFGYGRDEQD